MRKQMYIVGYVYRNGMTGEYFTKPCDRRAAYAYFKCFKGYESYAEIRIYKLVPMKEVKC